MADSYKITDNSQFCILKGRPGVSAHLRVRSSKIGDDKLDSLGKCGSNKVQQFKIMRVKTMSYASSSSPSPSYWWITNQL